MFACVCPTYAATYGRGYARDTSGGLRARVNICTRYTYRTVCITARCRAATRCSCSWRARGSPPWRVFRRIGGVGRNCCTRESGLHLNVTRPPRARPGLSLCHGKVYMRRTHERTSRSEPGVIDYARCSHNMNVELIASRAPLPTSVPLPPIPLKRKPAGFALTKNSGNERARARDVLFITTCVPCLIKGIGRRFKLIFCQYLRRSRKGIADASH